MFLSSGTDETRPCVQSAHALCSCHGNGNQIQRKTYNPEDFSFIKGLIASNPHDSRYALSLKLCKAWNWVQPNGVPKDMVCRGLMLQLHRSGYIQLPPRKRPPVNPLSKRKKPEVVQVSQEPLTVSVKTIRPLQFKQVRRTPSEKLFNSLVDRHHYLGYCRPVGEHLKYIVYAGKNPIACMAWSSAPRHIKSRDQFIGWSPDVRIKNLSLTENGRKGIFTTGILSKMDDRKAVLYFTGRNHAGENLKDLLQNRLHGLSPPQLMCDALSRNTSEDLEVILANCLTHGRRNFVDVASSFPEECQFVIETLAKVYHNDQVARDQSMTSEERLLFHQARSKPLMDALYLWFNKQLREKLVEPNSGLGKAISYMLNHWKLLTRFLEVPGVPLDNNVCERALKKAIIHRKNSLFYKTEHGALIGDIFMSLIQTCAMAEKNPFEYLLTIHKNPTLVEANPEKWLPWNFRQNLDHQSS